MIAKLIVKADTRKDTIKGLISALNSYQVEGIKTNISFLQVLLEHPAFRSGDTTTNFLERYSLVK